MSSSVLIVDDSLTVRMDLADAFEAAGFRALPCATVGEARAALSRAAVDAAILDVLLPDGDGVGLLAEIKRAPDGSGTAVLMLSMEAEVRDRVRALQVGADDYVGKPYDTGYVVSRVRELLRDRHAAASAAAAEPAPVTVLVVDDSETFREALRQSLDGAGYQVVTAPSGEEGLRVAADRRPSAMVIDGVMPGIDGAAVIRRVRLDAALRGTPCLLLTGADDSGAELRALDAGADAFVRKGEEVEVILAKLAALLRRPAVTPAGRTASLAGPRKVLAVDDSQTYLQSLAGALREDGYDVILARSGEEALDLLAVQPVDCVLLDLVMPGLGGKETCHRIKTAPVVREIPLIMLTAIEDRSAMIEGLSAGADDFISKSSEFEVLKARLRAQLRRRQLEDEHRRTREELLRRELEASEARAAQALAETKAALAEELERKNQELEAFSYSVSHDLRAPLRSINGFSKALEEDCADQLGEEGRGHLARVRAAGRRMDALIDDLLQLSRVSRAELVRSRVDVTEIAREVAEELRRREPGREVAVTVPEGIRAEADGRLLRVVLENLLGNAWKFTAKTERPEIKVGAEAREGGTVYFVRDNGAGFDMSHAARLFGAFQRLHTESEFPGTGIGLATVHRIVDRHGGRAWAEGATGLGATIFFTLQPPSRGVAR